MARYRNKKDTKKLGERIKELRKKHEFNIEDIAAMTGFSRSTITAIEKGAETSTTHLLEIAKAIGVPPRILFDIEVELKPRYQLTRKRKDQSRITARIRTMIESGYFREPRLVNDIREYLSDSRQLKVSAAQLSVVLLRMVKEDGLKISKKGRKNLYYRK